MTVALHARGYRAVVLWTLRDRQPTRSFYEASGWSFDGSEDTFDRHGRVHVVRYARDLSEPGVSLCAPPFVALAPPFVVSLSNHPPLSGAP